MSKGKVNGESVLGILLAVLAIAAIWKFFKDDDSGQVVSKAGRRVLDNKDSLRKVDDAIDNMKGHEDIVVNLN
ncbi:MAG: hypothetical protein ACPGLV_02770 [Bacteroidia bacterium]